MEVAEWFPANAKPSRVGMYEVRHKVSGRWLYLMHMFDGYIFIPATIEVESYAVLHQYGDQWRGLASNPE